MGVRLLCLLCCEASVLWSLVQRSPNGCVWLRVCDLETLKRRGSVCCATEKNKTYSNKPIAKIREAHIGLLLSYSVQPETDSCHCSKSLLPKRRPGFAPRSVLVEFVTDKVTLAQFLLPGLSPFVTIPQMLHIYLSVILVIGSGPQSGPMFTQKQSYITRE
jgi:hypothetical protein